MWNVLLVKHLLGWAALCWTSDGVQDWGAAGPRLMQHASWRAQRLGKEYTHAAVNSRTAVCAALCAAVLVL